MNNREKFLLTTLEKQMVLPLHKELLETLFKHKHDCKFLILNSEYVNKHYFLVSVI